MDRLTAQAQVFSSHAEAAYDDRCTIRRRVNIKDAGGGNRPQDVVIASDVPIRITPSSANERQIAGATQGQTAYTVRVPRLQSGRRIPLESNCFLDIAARGEVEAHTLSVIAPLPGSGRIDAVAVRQS